MKLGIMQPYFMPYLGYWQLMNYVDHYVIYDDVNYIKGGWINRNRILCNGEVNYFNLQLLGASPNKLINEIEVCTTPAVINKKLRILESSYGKAPYFKDVFPIIKSILHYDNSNLAIFLKNSFESLSQYLDIHTDFILSSTLDKDNSLKGQDKIISICKHLKATEYINASGGQHLYFKEAFAQNNLSLTFLCLNDFSYPQFSKTFLPNLSIIDVMMHNSKDDLKEALNSFNLI